MFNQISIIFTQGRNWAMSSSAFVDSCKTWSMSGITNDKKNNAYNSFNYNTVYWNCRKQLGRGLETKREP